MLPRELHQVSFGVLVRYLRKKNDLTQSKLASKAACSIGYVSEIERGEIPRRQIAELLVTALDPLDDERAALWAAYARATTTFAELEILAGFSGAVRDRLRAAMDDADIHDPQRCESFALLAWAECDLGHAEAAHDALAKAHQLAERLDARLAYVTIWRVEAIIGLTDRRWDDAAQALESLLALTRAMPAPYAEAKALYRAGQFSRERGDPAQAREHFEQALAILNRLGERLYAEWVARELAALA